MTDKIKRFKQPQKFRVISGDVSFYATAKEIRDGVGGFNRFNDAVQKALDSLEFSRSGTGVADRCATGLVGYWSGFSIQLDMV